MLIRSAWFAAAWFVIAPSGRASDTTDPAISARQQATAARVRDEDEKDKRRPPCRKMPKKRRRPSPSRKVSNPRLQTMTRKNRLTRRARNRRPPRMNLLKRATAPTSLRSRTTRWTRTVDACPRRRRSTTRRSLRRRRAVRCWTRSNEPRRPSRDRNRQNSTACTGESSVEELNKALGKPLAVVPQKDMVRRTYRLDGGERVEVACLHDVVQAIVVSYEPHPR